MRVPIVAAVCAMLIFRATPARADFKYTDTSTITGGSLKSMMKVAGIFSKQASQAMKPISTVRYLKANRLRTDNADAKIQIIDLDGHRIIEIDPQKHTYSEVSFDEMKAAIQKAADQTQQKADKDAKTKDVNAKVNAKFTVTPGTNTRQIMGVPTNETKVQMDMEVQAQDNSQPGQPVSGTISTTVDMWVAPSVEGYQEFSEFYRRMAQEINWVPPSNIQIDPRTSQSLEELQKNSSNLKGFPLLEYMTMSMAGQQGSAATTAQNSDNSQSSSSDSTPTSASGAMVKSLGGLFGKKKKQDDAPGQNNQNPPSTPGSLIEMTIEVTSYSDSPLDSSLFEVPAGYAKVQANADQIITPAPTGKH